MIDAKLETKALDMFEAVPLVDCHRAADQDGYDGGWTATDGERVAWGEAMEDARAALDNP